MPTIAVTLPAQAATRQSSIELLRIIAMVMVVTHHILLYPFGMLYEGNVANAAGRLLEFYTQLSVNALCIPAVTIFVLISGYFGINLKWRSCLNLYSIVLFYCLVDLVIGLWRGRPFDVLSLISPFLMGHYTPLWFIRAYLLLLVTAPLFNHFVNHLDNRQLRNAAFVAIGLNFVCGWLMFNDFNVDGHSFTQFIGLYILGKYIRRVKLYESFTTKQLLIGWSMATLSIILMAFAFHNAQNHGWLCHTFNYNNPLITVAGVCIVGIFAKMTFYNPAVNSFAVSIFGIYILQEATYGRELYHMFYQMHLNDDPRFWPWLAVYVIGLFALVWVLDHIRRAIASPLINRWAPVLESRWSLKNII